MPEELLFTVADLENLAVSNENFKYSGYYSQMSSGGAFNYHLFSGLRLYEFLKYCGVTDDTPDDTSVKFVSVDGFSHILSWKEIKNSTDNVYEKKGDNTPKYKNVPKILAFSSISIISDDGYEAEINVDDVLNGINSKYQFGQIKDVIIAYAINGKPMVYGTSDVGFGGYNGCGTLQLVAENQISKWVEHVVAVKVD